MRLQGYKFTISHHRGKDNIVPDALSKIYQDDVNALEALEPVTFGHEKGTLLSKGTSKLNRFILRIFLCFVLCTSTALVLVLHTA